MHHLENSCYNVQMQRFLIETYTLSPQNINFINNHCGTTSSIHCIPIISMPSIDNNDINNNTNHNNDNFQDSTSNANSTVQLPLPNLSISIPSPADIPMQHLDVYKAGLYV